MAFQNDLVVKVIEGGQYELVHAFEYLDYKGRTIIIPRGFKTDFASIPRFGRWLVTGHDDTRKAAVVHDYLCGGELPRREADLIFKHAMKEAGVPGWKRSLCYAAVAAYTLFTGQR